MAKKKNNKTLALIILIALIAFGFIGWRTFVYFPHPTTKPVIGTAVNSFEVKGVIEGAKWNPVYPSATGEVSELNAELGTQVKKGDVLAVISNPSESERIAEIQEQADALAAEKERLQKTIETNSSARNPYERVKTDLEQTVAELEAMKSRMDTYKIISPFDGTILKMEIAKGRVVSTGAPVFWIGEPKPIRVATVLNEEQVKQAFMGQLLQVTYDGHYLDGKVNEVIPVVDKGEKKTIIRGSLPDTAEIPISTTVDISFIIDKKPNSILVPFKAVKDNNVYVVRFGKVVPTPVKTGVKTGDNIEIQAGLQPDVVILPDVDAFFGTAPNAPAAPPAAPQKK